MIGIRKSRQFDKDVRKKYIRRNNLKGGCMKIWELILCMVIGCAIGRFIYSNYTHKLWEKREFKQAESLVCGGYNGIRYVTVNAVGGKDGLSVDSAWTLDEAFKQIKEWNVLKIGGGEYKRQTKDTIRVNNIAIIGDTSNGGVTFRYSKNNYQIYFMNMCTIMNLRFVEDDTSYSPEKPMMCSDCWKYRLNSK